MAKVKKRTALDKLMVTSEKTSESEIIPETSASPITGNQKQKLMVYVPFIAAEQLRSLAFEENRGRQKKKPLNDYFLEGLDLLFKQKGLKPISELEIDE